MGLENVWAGNKAQGEMKKKVKVDESNLKP